MAEAKNLLDNIKIVDVETVSPTSIAEVATIVRRAESEGRRVRPVGSLWSQSAAIHVEPGGILLGIGAMNRILGYASGDTADASASSALRALNAAARARHFNPILGRYYRKFVHVEGGVTIKQLYTALDTADGTRGRWALPTMGASSGQTIAGAISTATHGADFHSAPLADAVRAIHLVGPGGVEYWLERASEEERITDRARLLAGTSTLRAWSVRYVDDEFYAALVSVGCVGVIVGLVLEVGDQFGLSQRVTATRWSVVRQILTEEGPAGLDRRLGVVHPTTIAADGGTPALVRPLPWAAEILLNPYHLSDNYETDSAPDCDCVVVSRARAFSTVAFDSSEPVDPPGGPGELHLALDVEFHDVDTYRRNVSALMRSVRVTTTGYPPAYRVMDTFDGSGEPDPGHTQEIVVTTRDNEHIRLIEALRGAFAARVREGHKLAGFFSIRFTRPSRALLAMQHSSDSGRGELMCHIEVQGLKEIDLEAWGWSFGFFGLLGFLTVVFHDPVQHGGNLEGRTDDHFLAFESSAGRQLARMHWGQLHRLDRAALELTYPETLQDWRIARSALGRRGKLSTFSNSFSERCGLETNTDTLCLITTDTGRVLLLAVGPRGRLMIAPTTIAGGLTWGVAPGLGASIMGAISAVFDRGELKVFAWTAAGGMQLVRGAVEHLYAERHSNPFARLGLRATGPPAAVVRDGVGIEVFASASNTDLLHLQGGQASAPRRHTVFGPRGFRGAIAAVSPTPDRVHVFGLDSPTSLTHVVLSDTGSGALAVSDILTLRLSVANQVFRASPAAAAYGDQIHLFVNGANGQLLHGVVAATDTRSVRWEAISPTIPGEVERYEYPETAGVARMPEDAFYKFQRVTRPQRLVGPLTAVMEPLGTYTVFGRGEAGGILRLRQSGSSVMAEDLRGAWQ